MKPEVKEFLISYEKPQKLVTSDIVSSCIKDGLSPAGANVIVYKAHISKSPFLSKARDTWYHLYNTYLKVVGKELKSFYLKNNIGRSKNLKNLKFDYDAPLLSNSSTTPLLSNSSIVWIIFIT